MCGGDWNGASRRNCCRRRELLPYAPSATASASSSITNAPSSVAEVASTRGLVLVVEEVRALVGKPPRMSESEDAEVDAERLTEVEAEGPSERGIGAFPTLPNSCRFQASAIYIKRR